MASTDSRSIDSIILFSGGLDSTVLIAQALELKRNPVLLSFDYNQRHKIELEHAKKIAAFYELPQIVVNIQPDMFKKSALLSDETILKNRSATEMDSGKIPNTYVPARNTLFLSYAMAYAESYDAKEIYVGVNAMDHNSYPDCRPGFIQAFQGLLNVATKQAIEGNPPQIMTPLLHFDKHQIVALGKELKAPMHLSFSCYDPIDQHPCNACDACIKRNNALKEDSIAKTI